MRKRSAVAGTPIHALGREEPDRFERRQTYLVQWRRPGEGAVLECRGLTPQTFVKRLAAAVRNYGAVEILGIAPFDHVWHWRCRLPERKGQRCAVWARGRLNSIGVVFEDGYRVITSRYAVRRA